MGLIGYNSRLEEDRHDQADNYHDDHLAKINTPEDQANNYHDWSFGRSSHRYLVHRIILIKQNQRLERQPWWWSLRLVLHRLMSQISKHQVDLAEKREAERVAKAQGEGQLLLTQEPAGIGSVT